MPKKGQLSVKLSNSLKYMTKIFFLQLFMKWEKRHICWFQLLTLKYPFPWGNFPWLLCQNVCAVPWVEWSKTNQLNNTTVTYSSSKNYMLWRKIVLQKRFKSTYFHHHFCFSQPCFNAKCICFVNLKGMEGMCHFNCKMVNNMRPQLF